MAAAAAAGLLLGLTPEQMHHALGIAGSQSAGLMAAQYGSMVKRFHAGKASQSGVYGALLARRGFTGILPLFESEYGGYWTTFSPKHDPQKLVAGLGEVWETAAVGMKPYSACGSTHTSIDLLTSMKREHGFAAEQVDSVRVLASTVTTEHVGWPYVPDSVTTAQMCLPYAAAVSITDGEAFIDQYTEARVRDEALVSLAERVKVTADPEIDAKGDSYRHFVKMEVRLRDGGILRDERNSAKGSASDPMSREEIEVKFRRLATTTLSPERALDLQAQVYGLDSLDDLRPVVANLAGGAR
jgi:2-methylcitrate dehydratase PrpD